MNQTISPQRYCEEFLDHYKDHRCIIAETLLAEYLKDDCTDRAKAILAARILQEYGNGVEELFAYTFTACRYCHSLSSSAKDPASVFFETLFDYAPKEVFDFVEGRDFRGSLSDILALPERAAMAQRLGLEDYDYDQSTKTAEDNIEFYKSRYFNDDLKNIYNKLKHPFLALEPEVDEKTGEWILPVVVRPTSRKFVGRPIKVAIGPKPVRGFVIDIHQVACTQAFIIRLMLVMARG